MKHLSKILIVLIIVFAVIYLVNNDETKFKDCFKENNTNINEEDTNTEETVFSLHTMKYVGTETSNMNSENNAELVSLDPNLFTVSASKGSHSSFPGLNKDGTIRMYANATLGNSISVLISSGNIVSIEISVSNGAEYLQVSSGVNIINELNGLYVINNNNFSLLNTSTDSTQVQISSIKIICSSKKNDKVQLSGSSNFINVLDISDSEYNESFQNYSVSEEKANYINNTESLILKFNNRYFFKSMYYTLNDETPSNIIFNSFIYSTKDDDPVIVSLCYDCTFGTFYIYEETLDVYSDALDYRYIYELYDYIDVAHYYSLTTSDSDLSSVDKKYFFVYTFESNQEDYKKYYNLNFDLNSFKYKDEISEYNLNSCFYSFVNVFSNKKYLLNFTSDENIIDIKFKFKNDKLILVENYSNLDFNIYISSSLDENNNNKIISLKLTDENYDHNSNISFANYYYMIEFDNLNNIYLKIYNKI